MTPPMPADAPHVLAIDQGTTSSRAIVFDARFGIAGQAQQEFPQIFPQNGWVEHVPADLLRSVLDTCRAALQAAGLTPGQIAAIGITNQRETTLIWDRQTGRPIHNAIVWQDRRTAPLCERLAAEGLGAHVTARTGLLLDPYFSATKIAWLLDTVEGARARAEAGHLAFGTVDSWLVWALTGGRVHVTDATNAARTMLYDIHRGGWDEEICATLGIPMALLPQVRDSAAEFGMTDPAVFGAAVSIRGIAGDQQAATIGQACFSPGMMKSTYGTGCFALLNTGTVAVRSRNRLLTTIAYQLDGTPTYALEGAIFVAGAVVQWLRDALGMIDTAGQSADLARAADPGQSVVIVPAFTGLGAPYWKAHCRGAVLGLTRDSGPEAFARAALESVGHQTRDLLDAMRADWGQAGQAALRVDGGMSASDWAMQFLADITGAPVERPAVQETTAKGAAWLAGRASGIYPDMAEFAAQWQADTRFDPVLPTAEREAKHARWARAVSATIRFSEES